MSKNYDESVIDKYEYWKFIYHLDLVKEMYAPPKTNTNSIGDIFSLT
jgi:hypothetical protein